jgi:phosphonate transport system permease protein
VVAFLAVTWASLSEQFGIGLVLGDLIEDITRGAGILVSPDVNPPAAKRGLLVPNWEFLTRTFEPMLETFQMAIVASAIGCAIALPVAFLVSRVTAPNRPALVFGRSLLSVVRAIPDILYALVFVAAVGIGPLAGIAALILFNLGVVAKLLSETVDGIDVGPIEAARAGGANRSQTVRWAVLPQVLPNYVAYSLYTFELNIRASTVIGVVGAGGIGNLLFTQYRFFNWSNVSMIVVELFVLVMLIEFLSISLRRRLV